MISAGSVHGTRFISTSGSIDCYRTTREPQVLSLSMFFPQRVWYQNTAMQMIPECISERTRSYLGHPKPSKTLFLIPKSPVFEGERTPLFFMVLGAPGRFVFWVIWSF